MTDYFIKTTLSNLADYENRHSESQENLFHFGLKSLDGACQRLLSWEKILKANGAASPITWSGYPIITIVDGGSTKEVDLSYAAYYQGKEPLPVKLRDALAVMVDAMAIMGTIALEGATKIK